MVRVEQQQQETFGKAAKAVSSSVIINADLDESCQERKEDTATFPRKVLFINRDQSKAAHLRIKSWELKREFESPPAHQSIGNHLDLDYQNKNVINNMGKGLDTEFQGQIITPFPETRETTSGKRHSQSIFKLDNEAVTPQCTGDDLDELAAHGHKIRIQKKGTSVINDVLSST